MTNTINTLLFAYIDMVTIKIKYVPEPILTQLAINEYNNWKNSYRVRFRYLTENSKPEVLNRIKKNYIRHNLTNYEEILREIRGLEGAGKVYPILKWKVMNRIDTEWSKRQKSERIPKTIN
jgi:predicted patatin/cPLA2 family phospholipase